MGRMYDEFNFDDDIELVKLDYQIRNKINCVNSNENQSFQNIKNSEAYQQPALKKKKWHR